MMMRNKVTPIFFSFLHISHDDDYISKTNYLWNINAYLFACITVFLYWKKKYKIYEIARLINL